jgi:hypothetical protein
MRLALFLAVGFSITNTLVFLHVFHWLRVLISGLTDREFQNRTMRRGLQGFRQEYLGRLVRCHACAGFWVGVSLSLIGAGSISEYMDLSFPLDVVGDGFLLSVSNFGFWLVLRRLGAEEL